MKINILYFLLFFIIYSAEITAQNPLFPNSVVSNDIDFILETDPDTFTSLAFVGLDNKEMPDSQSDILFDEDTFVFEATFSDGETLEIWCHSSFLSQAAAQEYADKLCPRLGKLPVFQRNMLDHVVIHNGNAGAFAEIEGQFFILYSENMDARISTNDLEETVFHESVHASYQFGYQNDPLWTNAQAADPTFVTEYGQNNPELEDMAETALFAYAFITYPGRLSADIESWLEENVPNRIEFFRTLYPSSVTGINSEAFEATISTYPNPTKDKCIVTLETTKVDDYINIFGITGELVVSIKAIAGKNELELEELSNGIYFLVTPDHRVSKIIKQ